MEAGRALASNISCRPLPLALSLVGSMPKALRPPFPPARSESRPGRHDVALGKGRENGMGDWDRRGRGRGGFASEMAKRVGAARALHVQYLARDPRS